jgi:hypothetical protein
MTLAILLVLIGLAGPVAAFQWRRGRWLSTAQWIQANVSSSAVVATPVLGVVVVFAGVMMVWPPAVLLTSLTSLGLILILGSAARGGVLDRAFPNLEETGGEPVVEELSQPRRKAS